MATGSHEDSFDRLLLEAAHQYPSVAKVMYYSGQLRQVRWREFTDPIDLKALECVMVYFKDIEKVFLSDKHFHDLAFLPRRLADNFISGFHGFLSGYEQAASDAMRDTIEVELLIRDFAIDITRISLWRSSDEKALLAQFSPNTLRQRQARYLGINSADVPGAADYKAHSQLLHVRPPLLFQRTPIHSTRAMTLIDLLADLMHHGESSLRSAHELAEKLRLAPPSPDMALTAIGSSANDLGTAHGASVAIETQIADNLASEGIKHVVVFENRLALAFGDGSKSLNAYRISAVDFRRFHREVAKSGTETFQLEPLEENDVNT